jgi:hypothetical protein
MNRVSFSAVSLLLLCAVVQGCGPQDESSNGFDTEVHEGTETATTENPPVSEPEGATSEEDRPVSGFTTHLLASYESDTYVEGFTLNYQSFLCTSCSSTIRVEHWTRQCGLCSYRKYAEYSLQPGQQVSSCNDGRRTRVYVYGSYNDRSAYTWNFNFWNCS